MALVIPMNDNVLAHSRCMHLCPCQDGYRSEKKRVTVWMTIGHARAVNLLRRSLKEGRLSHAYVIAGPRHVGKMTLAIDLARALNCTGDDSPCGVCAQCSRTSRGLHAGVRVVGLETGETPSGRARVLIGIDQVREVQREASLAPFEGTWRVIIIDGAEHLSEEAANSLLKTLEEPPDRVVLLLLASEAGALLPTIVSRCQLLELRPVPGLLISRELAERHGVDPGAADEIARRSQGRPGWALRAIEDPGLLEGLAKQLDTIEGVVKGGVEQRFAYAASLASAFDRDRDSGRRELDTWLAWWRDLMLVKQGVPEFVTHVSSVDTFQGVAAALSSDQVVRSIGAIKETLSYMERNVNTRLALEDLMLGLPRP